MNLLVKLLHIVWSLDLTFMVNYYYRKVTYSNRQFFFGKFFSPYWWNDKTIRVKSFYVQLGNSYLLSWYAITEIVMYLAQLIRMNTVVRLFFSLMNNEKSMQWNGEAGSVMCSFTSGNVQFIMSNELFICSLGALKLVCLVFACGIGWLPQNRWCVGWM